MKKVSIIVPVYNVEKYLAKCLDSLVNQTLKDIEIIVVNDGSPDNSEQIIKKYLKKYPDKIIYLKKENGGQGSARNLGIEKSNGEYIGFVDSDDYVDINMFEKMYNKVKEKESDIVICGRYEVDEITSELTPIGVIKKDKDPKKNAFYDQMAPWNKIYKASLIKNNDIKFGLGMWYEDVVFCIKSILLTDKITYLDENLYYYLVRNGSTMNNHNSIKNLDVLKALDIIKKFAIKNNCFDKNIYSYLVFDYVLITTINRVMYHDNKDKKNVINKLRNYCKENISDYRKLPFYKEVPKNRKIIANLNYLGLFNLSKLLLDTKSKIKR